MMSPIVEGTGTLLYPLSVFRKPHWPSLRGPSSEADPPDCNGKTHPEETSNTNLLRPLRPRDILPRALSMLPRVGGFGSRSDNA
jgi:hypothetical protein